MTRRVIKPSPKTGQPEPEKSMAVWLGEADLNDTLRDARHVSVSSGEFSGSGRTKTHSPADARGALGNPAICSSGPH